MPAFDHSLLACRAQLAEAADEWREAATLYSQAAERWRGFGSVRERAYATLGEGRCLLALGEARAKAPLAEARRLFESMGYKPALAEAERLLANRILASIQP